MYIIFSTPLTCCSMGAATVSATTWALAPGYAQATWIVGGVMSGYWAIGRLTSASSPIRVITIEMTQAKTGRSMKNRANKADLLYDFPAREEATCRPFPLLLPLAAGISTSRGATGA